MIDIDHGNSSDAHVASPPSTQRNPSRDGWGCLVFGPSLLRRSRELRVPIRKSPHGRDLGQELSQIAPMQRGLRMVSRCSQLNVPGAKTLQPSSLRGVPKSERRGKG